MKPLRIVSIDGSTPLGGNGYLAAGVLKDLRSRLDGSTRNSFLNNVDLFAGNSAGAWNALFFAMHDDPDDALDDVLNFWQEVVNEMPPSRQAIPLLRLAGAAVGASAVVNTEPVRQFFIRYFGQTRMRDLKKKVMITSFQLDNEDPERRCWKPKIFHNLFDGDQDLDELVLDVALRSGSPPVVDPIYQGLNGTGPTFIDGGVFANNPSMCALAQIRHLGELRPDVAAEFDKILLYSVGNGHTFMYVDPRTRNGMANWGYAQWMFNPLDPAKLLYLMLDANVLAVDYQCRHILRDNYHRTSIRLQKPVGLDEVDVNQGVQQMLDAPGASKEIEAAKLWLEKNAWFQA